MGVCIFLSLIELSLIKPGLAQPEINFKRRLLVEALFV